MTTAERNRAIKTVLGKLYGRDKVRVRGGRGTSYGWAHIYIDLQPRDPEQSRQWHKAAFEAMTAAGITFGTYYIDDGYGTEAKSYSLHFERSRYRQTTANFGLTWDDQWVPLDTAAA